MSEQVLLLFLALCLVLLNGFFVAAEFAIVKVRATRIRELADAGSWRAQIAQNIIEHLDAYLSATQLGITLASIGLGWIGEPTVARLLESPLRLAGLDAERWSGWVHTVSFVIAYLLIAFLHIVLGELAPKSLAIRMPEATSLWIALPLRAFYTVMKVPIVALNGTANALLRLFGLEPAGEGDSAHSEEELRMIVASSHAHGVLNATERKLLENVIDFSDRRVAEIMVPRLDMVCLYASKSLAENLAIVYDNLHTRYPLATDDKDHILGMVHVKDLLPLTARPVADVESIRRDVMFVPETTTIDRLLRMFQRRNQHMAIVVDEYGGIAGLVTLDDVLEEIVGPIPDEFDAEDVREAQRDEQKKLLDGVTPLSEAATQFGFDVPADAQVNTIGGYILQRLGRVPRVGEGITLGPYRAEVAEMERMRITRVRLRRMAPAEAPAPAPGASPPAGNTGAAAAEARPSPAGAPPRAPGTGEPSG